MYRMMCRGRRRTRLTWYLWLTALFFSTAFYVYHILPLWIFFWINPASYAPIPEQPIKYVARKHSEQTILNTMANHSMESGPDLAEYRSVLTSRADVNKTVVLAFVDWTFVDMALNFHETSLFKFGIRNYLFIGSNVRTCAFLNAKKIACYLYLADNNAERITVYGTKEFKRKMNIRTLMILHAVQMGFTVLHTDVDVVFLQNPFRDIHCKSPCKMSALLDKSEDTSAFNAGFVYVKPSNFTISVYTRMKKIAMTTNTDDQKALNEAVRIERKSDVSKYFYAQNLPAQKYVNGKYFFEYGNRHFAGNNPCAECVVVHNNWIVTKEAKRYRFRELHFWMNDDGGYYSDQQRRYMTYEIENVSKLTEDVVNRDLIALQTALFISHVLNRTLILPKFRCDQFSPFCPLNSLISIAAFDAVFEGKYRESTFLSHPKVLKAFSQAGNGIDKIHRFNDITSTSEQSHDGPSRQEIQGVFSGVIVPVLRLDSLYGLYTNFGVPQNEMEFAMLLSRAFVRSNYRQME